MICSWIVSMAWSSAITSDLQTYLQTASAEEWIPIQMTMNEQYDAQVLSQAVQNLPKAARRALVINTLKDYTAKSQADILAALRAWGAREVTSLWINNTIICQANRNIITALQARTDLERLDIDEVRNLLSASETSFDSPQSQTREITDNVLQVNADEVWALGFRGAGVIVAVIDTGVKYTHQDVADHMWTDPGFPYHGFDYANNDNNPMDDHGHGSHCAGTVGGDGTAGSQTGMAPDATIMAIKVLTGTGDGEESSVWSAYQFALDHGANVISQSLGWAHSWSPNRTAWRQAVVNLNIAGLPTVVANGNEGSSMGQYPIPDNVRTPADCPPPWLNPNQTLTGGMSAVIAVGAVNSSDTPADFTSRGPVTWSSIAPYNDYAYQPGMGLIRPDVCAPGVNIKSLNYLSNTGYTYMDGTSMAAPCVAGVVALMLSKNPNIDPAEIDETLETTALHIAANKNNTTGSGRVNALAAVNAIPFPIQPPDPAENPRPENYATNVVPGIHLDWQDGGASESYTVYFGTDYPPTNLVNGAATTGEFYYNPNIPLEYETMYFWRVDATNQYGMTPGPVWAFMTGTPPDESFEAGSLDGNGWETADVPWVIDNSAVMHGFYSIKSGLTPNSSNSTVFTTRTVFVADTLRFFIKTSCQTSETHNTDYLEFLVNGFQRAKWDGETDWTEFEYPLTPGTHELAWRYHKDMLTIAGQDCAWVDYITFPPCNNPPIDIIANTISLLENQISWTAPVEGQTITGYNVYRNGVLYADTPLLTFTDADSTVGSHVYRISAVYGEVESPASFGATLDIFPTPTALTGNSANNHVNLHWSVPPGNGTVVRYNIYRNRRMVNYTANGNMLTYIDTPPTAGEYDYFVTALYADGESASSNEITVNFTVGNDDNVLPVEINPNVYPNPFRSNMLFSYNADGKSLMTVDIYNVKGQLIKTLWDGTAAKGNHHLSWDAADQNGNPVSPGVYLLKWHSGKASGTLKVMTVK